MKVCGFTFIRNAVRYDFPIVEAITSVLPLCDMFVVAAGDSDDGTRTLIERIDPVKIKIIDTKWDKTLNKEGVVYAAETNKAFHAIPDDFDWCFYIQGDEVLHEKYLLAVKSAMTENLHHHEVDGLLFGYRHFYGTYDYTGDSRKWYRNEIRVIRNNKSISSYRDAQGFRKEGKKLKVVPANAEIYHYGWVRHPSYMHDKIVESKKYYIGAEAVVFQKATERAFNFNKNYDALVRFKGTHPQVMQERIKRLNWKVDIDLNKIKMKPTYRLLHFFEKKTGFRLFEYRNYSLLKKPTGK
jgi:hypothetical protein